MVWCCMVGDFCKTRLGLRLNGKSKADFFFTVAKTVDYIVKLLCREMTIKLMAAHAIQLPFSCFGIYGTIAQITQAVGCCGIRESAGMPRADFINKVKCGFHKFRRGWC